MRRRFDSGYWFMALLLMAVFFVAGVDICTASPKEVTRYEYETFTRVRKLLEKKQMEDASKLMEGYFRKNGKKHSMGYELYGYILMADKQTKKAAKILEDGFAFYPENASIAQNLGAAHGHNKNYQRAAEMFYRAYNLYKEKKPGLLYTAGVFYYRDKNYPKAVKLANSLLELENSKPDWHLLKIQCHMEEKNFKKAKTALENSLGIFPHDARMWRMLGFTYHQLGDPKRAVATYEIAYRLKPASEKEKNQLIGLYASIGAPHLGEFHADDHNMLDAKLLDNLAYGLACSGNLKKALEKIETALEIEPTEVRKYQRAVILMRMGEKAKARKAFESLAHMKSKFGGKANWSLAMLAWTENRWLEVLTHLHRAGKADPKLVKQCNRLTRIVESVLEQPAHASM